MYVLGTARVFLGSARVFLGTARIFLGTKNLGYMAKSGPNGLIFGAIGTEFQGEANSGVILASQYDFHAYL